jgi:hypothetical protein
MADNVIPFDRKARRKTQFEMVQNGLMTPENEITAHGLDVCAKLVEGLVGVSAEDFWACPLSVQLLLLDSALQYFNAMFEEDESV